ncbi:MAG: DinB family protein [Thermoanaerobaculia bacterium]|nr:DinB family protein [Thermoanaerobaculia bacterium]
MSNSLPPRWLRGPVEGVPDLLQPVAHALLETMDELETAVANLDAETLVSSPGGAASVGFHLVHLVGSTDRLLTYARGESLSASQRQQLERERAAVVATADEVLAELRTVIESGLGQLRDTDPKTLLDERRVGGKQLPSTVLGLLFHAAEHAQRHCGQVVTTLKVLA